MTEQNNRGGKREGAGRKAIGETRKVSLTLSPEMWGVIESICEDENSSQSKVLRNVIERNMPSNQMVKEIKDFQNGKIGADIYNDEEIVDWCIKLVHEIFIEKKHKYEPDLK